MRFILYLFFSVVLLSGCKPKQKAASTNASTDEIEAKKQAYNNLVISFYSKGEGVNSKAVEAIESYLQEYSSQIKRAIPYSKIRWGKEGEVDFCISLAELKGEERKIFVDKTRGFVSGFELIHFNENHPCRQVK